MPSRVSEEIKSKAAAMFLNFSDLLGKDILDVNRKFVGKIWDVSVKIGEIYPRSEELIIKSGPFKRRYASIPFSGVSAIEDEIVLNLKSENIRFHSAIKEYEFLLRRDMLDQQVVDMHNHKVIRVNDIHLLKVDNDLMVAHVDIGMRGLVRRLGWEKWVDLIIKALFNNARYLKMADMVSWKFIQPVAINPASMSMKLSVSQKQLQSIPPADLGEIIFDLNMKQRMALFKALDIKTKAKIFENIEFQDQEAILKELDKKEAAQVITNMSSDEAADLLGKLSRDTVHNILSLIESSRAKKLSGLLGYSSDSAGGLMTTEFVSLPETMLVEGAIEYIKTQTKEFDTVPYVYVVDSKHRLQGVTTVRRLLFSENKDPISNIIFPSTIYVHLHDSVKEVAYLMDKYKISAIPVVDENKVLHGIITVDDILSQVVSIAWRKRPRKQKVL